MICRRIRSYKRYLKVLLTLLLIFVIFVSLDFGEGTYENGIPEKGNVGQIHYFYSISCFAQNAGGNRNCPCISSPWSDTIILLLYRPNKPTLQPNTVIFAHCRLVAFSCLRVPCSSRYSTSLKLTQDVFTDLPRVSQYRHDVDLPGTEINNSRFYLQARRSYPRIVIYNRVPKCGSSTLRFLISKLRIKNHFNYKVHNWPNVKQSLTPKEEVSLLYFVPLLSSRSVQRMTGDQRFTDFDAQINMLYASMLRFCLQKELVNQVTSLPRPVLFLRHLHHVNFKRYVQGNIYWIWPRCVNAPVSSYNCVLRYV